MLVLRENAHDHSRIVLDATALIETTWQKDAKNRKPG
jgi:hypothetical protein